MSTDSASKRLLFVDDEPGIRATLPVILRDSGYVVTVAGTVAEALELIDTESFDVVVSDLNIEHPDDGYRIVDAVREVDRHCLAIILTGYPALETVVEGINHGIDGYLIKPAGAEAVVSAIAEKLAARKPRARILSVSYDLPLLRTRNMLLEREGYEVVSTSTLPESLEHCEKGGFDVFIIGHSIPHSQRQYLASEFRQRCRGAIISLRRSDGDQRVEGADHEIDPDPEPLLKLVAQLTRKKPQRRRADN